jgi:TfoX/Sxy family transcriptional regulator of competence genes
MAYDLALADRIRPLLNGRKGVTEKQMFGGLAFLRDGKMFVGIVKDELMARVGKADHAEWVRKKGARIMDFSGRPMAGYIFVKSEGLVGRELARWIEQCWVHVDTVTKAKKRAKASKKAMGR